jgi:hypothetical protein
MTHARVIPLTVVLAAGVLCATVACSSGAEGLAARTTAGHPPALSRVVASPVCAPGQLQARDPKARDTRLRIRSADPGYANTRKTAIEIEHNSLLVITIGQQRTNRLAVTTGCWVRSQSHVKRGVITVAFLMTRIGEAKLLAGEQVPAGAEVGLREWYIHTVQDPKTADRRVTTGADSRCSTPDGTGGDVVRTGLGAQSPPQLDQAPSARTRRFSARPCP